MANAQHVISLGLSRRLADLLVEEKLITPSQLGEALDAQKSGGEKLGTILIDKGIVPEENLLQFLAEKTGISFVSLADIGDIPEEAVQAVPEAIARQKMLMPFNKTKDRLTVAIADPLDVMVLDDLKMLSGCDVIGCLASESEIIAARRTPPETMASPILQRMSCASRFERRRPCFRRIFSRVKSRS